MASYSDKAQEYLKTKNEETDNGEMNATIRNAVVGLTPTLMNFLSNRSAQMKMRGFQKANKFTEGLAAEKGVEVDVNGKPVLMPEGEAMFRQPYQKPLASPGSNSSLLQGYTRAFNKTTGESELINILKDGRYAKTAKDGSLIVLDPTQYTPDYGVGTLKTKNEFDETITSQYKKNIPSDRKVVGKDSSSARKEGFKSKAEEKRALDAIDDVNKQNAKLQGEIETAKSSYRDLLREGTNLTPEGAAIAIQNIIRPINVDRMSDSDYVRMKGAEYKSLIQKFESWMSGSFTGKITQREVDAYIEAASNAIITLELKKKSNIDTMLPSGSYGDKASKFIKSKTGSGDAVKEDFKSLKERLKAKKWM